MTPTSQAMHTFDIEGQEVRCYRSDGQNLWRCECSAFRRRLSQYGEGFCAHTAVAIMRSVEDGSIKF
jgi:hypothetical protein